MNKEEKEAIEQLKILIGLEEFNKLSYKENQSIKILLNLIKKQQEEIEEKDTRLQEEINENCKLKTELYGNSIHKDKIREKIKEYQKHIDNINNKAPKRKDGKPNNLFNHANRDFYKSKVEVLEELLGEEDE